MSKLSLYPYGFIFSTKSLENIPHTYEKKHIKNTYWYYYDNKMPFSYSEKKEMFLLIHGHYTYVHPDEEFIHEQIPNILLQKYTDDYESFLDFLDFLAGRYVIIAGNSEDVNLYQDAVGSRSVYYSLTNHMVGSHAHLVADNKNDVLDELVNEYPNLPKISTRTPFKNVRSMLPNFKLDFKKHKLSRFFPRNENVYYHITEKEKVALVDYVYKKQIEYYVQAYEKVIHSITGGIDSRASLAATKDYFDDIKYFTYTLSKSKVNTKKRLNKRYEEDKILVNEILSYLPVDHSHFYIQDERLNISEKIEAVLDKNTVVHHGRNLIPYYINYVKDSQTIHIRGNAGGIIKSTYLSENELRGISFLVKKLVSNMRLKKSKPASNKLISYLKEELISLGYNQKIHGYEGLDMAYWEIRVGRFHAEIFNETDVAFDSLNLINVRAALSASLSFDLHKRKNGYLMEEIINENIPYLNFYGKNHLSNMYEQNKINNLLSDRINLAFNTFKVFDNEAETFYEIETKKNMLYIPKNYIIKNNYVFKRFDFNLNQGFVEIEIFNDYSAAKGKGYLKYEVYKNTRLLLSEDIAVWKYTNNVSIFNLTKGDQLEIRLVALRTTNAESWEKASTTMINHYREKSYDKHALTEVLSTSPFSVIHT